jgi:hypothetical protein
MRNDEVLESRNVGVEPTGQKYSPGIEEGHYKGGVVGEVESTSAVKWREEETERPNNMLGPWRTLSNLIAYCIYLPNKAKSMFLGSSAMRLELPDLFPDIYSCRAAESAEIR